MAPPSAPRGPSLPVGSPMCRDKDGQQKQGVDLMVGGAGASEGEGNLR